MRSLQSSSVFPLTSFPMLRSSNEGEGLLFYGNVIIPFVDRFPKHLELYRYMTTKPEEVKGDLQ